MVTPPSWSFCSTKKGDPIDAAEDSKRSIFSGHKNEGTVRAEMCGTCGRITLRGEVN